MHKLILFIFLFFTSCDEVTELQRTCQSGTECWLPPGSENNQNNIIFDFNPNDYQNRNGFCGAGYLVCKDEQFRCEGVRYAKEEVCDGVDNDCNGIVDDPEKFYAGIANTKCYFEELGECRYSEQACIGGELVCVYSTSPNYGPEVCDGKDNDCDGEYDEDVPQNFVYEGSFNTINVGECRAGITICENGREKIFGMVLPRTEICTNNKDDDCDGLVDEQETGLAAVDYAFYIDFSGSMVGDRLDTVLNSVCSFVDNPMFISSRFAMVGISLNGVGELGNSDEYGTHVITDFTDIGSACNILNQFVSENILSLSDELQLDAVLMSFDPESISLDWSDNQRRVYIFSDEPPQCLSEDNLNDKMNELIDSCNTNDFTVGVFTLPDFYLYGWQTLVGGCGGFLEDIDSLGNENYFQNNFLAWFGSSC